MREKLKKLRINTMGNGRKAKTKERMKGRDEGGKERSRVEM
jgi:hypothetical protein